MVLSPKGGAHLFTISTITKINYVRCLHKFSDFSHCDDKQKNFIFQERIQNFAEGARVTKKAILGPLEPKKALKSKFEFGRE